LSSLQEQKKDAVTVIHAGWILVYEDGSLKSLKDHDLVIKGDKIEEIIPVRYKGHADVEIDAQNGVALPGFINLHTHADPVLHGTTVDLYPPYDGERDPRIPIDLDTVFLYSVFFPMGNVVCGKLSVEERKALTKLGLMGLVKGGSTTIFEQTSNGAELFAEAAIDLGARVYACDTYHSMDEMPVYDKGKVYYGEHRSAPFAGLEKAIELHKKYDGQADGRIHMALGPHATDTCCPELLRATRAAADKLGCKLTIHVAQSKSEMIHVQEAHGKTPVEYLEENNFLGPDFIGAHGVYANNSDREILKKTGSTIVHCATSFSKGGIPVPLKPFVDAGVNLGVGTDSFSVDYLIELRTAGFIAKVNEEHPWVATARDMLTYGTVNGAKALGRTDIGRLASGAKADVIVVNLNNLQNSPVLDPMRKLVYLSNHNDVETVLIDGRLIVDKGRFITEDEEAVVEKARPAFEKVWRLCEEAGLYSL